MVSQQYFDFIHDVWQNLPPKDRDRMAELWKGYEQVAAAAYQKLVEASINVAVADVFPFSDERWLPYEFGSKNVVHRAATYRSNQDLSVGVNLSSRYLIKVSWDDEDPVEIDLRGPNPENVSTAHIVQAINLAAGFPFVAPVVSNALLEFTSPTAGPQSRITFHETSNPALNACEFVAGVDPLALPFSVPEFPYPYRSPYPRLVSIPELRAGVRKDKSDLTLKEGVDYNVSGGIVAFRQEPPEHLWAKRSLFDEETPWNNFGFLLNIYQKNSRRYVEVIQGLWFAFWTGPRPENLRKALYLLFGLPTSPFEGTVTGLTTTEVRLTSDDGVPATYPIPSGLEATVSLGDRVEIFQPLVTGIDVFDKVNRPGFIRDEVGRAGIQRFLTDRATRGPGETDETKALTLLEEFCFLPQILVDAFISPDINIANVRLFLDAIKPVTKAYLFQVIIGNFRDEVEFDDAFALEIDKDVSPNVDSNETTFLLAADLDTQESTPHAGLNVDSEGILFEESVEVEVGSFGMTIDLFDA